MAGISAIAVGNQDHRNLDNVHEKSPARDEQDGSKRGRKKRRRVQRAIQQILLKPFGKDSNEGHQKGESANSSPRRASSDTIMGTKDKSSSGGDASKDAPKTSGSPPVDDAAPTKTTSPGHDVPPAMTDRTAIVESLNILEKFLRGDRKDVEERMHVEEDAVEILRFLGPEFQQPQSQGVPAMPNWLDFHDLTSLRAALGNRFRGLKRPLETSKTSQADDLWPTRVITLTPNLLRSAPPSSAPPVDVTDTQEGFSDDEEDSLCPDDDLLDDDDDILSSLPSLSLNQADRKREVTKSLQIRNRPDSMTLPSSQSLRVAGSRTSSFNRQTSKNRLLVICDSVAEEREAIEDLLANTSILQALEEVLDGEEKDDCKSSDPLPSAFSESEDEEKEVTVASSQPTARSKKQKRQARRQRQRERRRAGKDTTVPEPQAEAKLPRDPPIVDSAKPATKKTRRHKPDPYERTVIALDKLCRMNFSDEESRAYEVLRWIQKAKNGDAVCWSLITTPWDKETSLRTGSTAEWPIARLESYEKRLPRLKKLLMAEISAGPANGMPQTEVDALWRQHDMLCFGEIVLQKHLSVLKDEELQALNKAILNQVKEGTWNPQLGTNF